VVPDIKKLVDAVASGERYNWFHELEAEVKDLLKINEKTVYRPVADSKIPGFKVGGSWRFERGTIAKW